MSRPREIRPLGKLEQYSSSRHALGFYRCVASTCCYAIPASLRRESATLQPAFRLAVKDVALLLPSLRVGIMGDRTKTPRFVHVDLMRLSNHFDWRQSPSRGECLDESALSSILEEQHSTFFQDIHERPPWKAVCVQFTRPSDPKGEPPTTEVYVIFAVHHSLADGTGAAVFHSHLLAALNKQLSRTASCNQEGDAIALTETLAIPPPLDELCSFKISWPFFLRALWGEFAPSWLRGPQPPLPWTGKPVTLEPSRTNIRMVQLSSSTLDTVLAACRTHETTLTPLVHAIVLYSLVQRFPEENTERFISSTPINLRQFMSSSILPKPEAAKLIGTYVSNQDHIFETGTVASLRSPRGNAEMPQEAVWTVAKSVKADLQKRIDMMFKDDLIGMLPWVSDWSAFWLKRVGCPRNTTWEVSNLGSMLGIQPTNGPEKGGWEITQSIFTQSAIVAGPCFTVNISGVKESGIAITICWQEGIVEAGLMHAVAGDLRTCLQRISSR